MKLRIRGNSLRFRLAQADVATLRECGAVRVQTEFPGGAVFAYAVEAGAELAALCSRDGVRVCLPEADVSRWSRNDEVSLSYDVAISSADSLHVLVEKDFACLAPRDGEDESDLFPHPLAGKSRC